MILRLILVLLLLAAALWLLHRLRTMPRALLARRLRQAAIWGLVAVLVLAVLTGRLNPLFALLGAAIPVLMRLLAFLRLVPELQQILRSLGLGVGAGAGSANGGAGQGTPPNSGALSEDEARAILGVDAKADAEAIRAAHRRLMQRLHPDRGGSDYLAARINAAKRRLLGD
ncbi:molecular chaperone DnaJ [Allochromatium humboldtianum]|uniref:Molecular chaperone DnaJ n=1 Tax=Allochromatium humboldtianum TaxID=504901 RepID=A0A850RE05_9GAMM|nr:molecular chaperone DnaJ [Allochromatium humboldtianum]NVZ09190.1 molecular chaperone DnaJ [Allochromatium humboldtianum]